MKEIEGLVLVKDLDKSIIIDLKYATKNNFTGEIIYPINVCAINKETGKLLVEASKIFRRDGYTLKIFDAYRPMDCQRRMFEVYPNEDFVAKVQDDKDIKEYKPTHYSGMAVDITLVDSEQKELKMPSEFDDFSEKASSNLEIMNKEARKNFEYMLKVMESVGFENYDKEWWHFSDKINIPRKYLNVNLSDFS